MKNIRSKNTRYLIALIIGIIVALGVGLYRNWTYAPLAGWDSTALAMLLLIVWDMHGATAKTTATIARRDDMNHSLLDVIAVLGSLASLGAVVYLLGSTDKSIAHVAFGLVSIVISWATIHMLYALRYAAMYYRDIEGGIYFGSDEKPRFTDFIYLAYTVGMTYQASDTTYQTSEFRKVTIGHALISFVFGTATIATTINFLASLSK